MMGEVNGHKLRQLPCELRVSLIHKGLTFYKVHEKYPSLNYLFFFFSHNRREEQMRWMVEISGRIEFESCPSPALFVKLC